MVVLEVMIIICEKCGSEMEISEHHVFDNYDLEITFRCPTCKEKYIKKYDIKWTCPNFLIWTSFKS